MCRLRHTRTMLVLFALLGIALADEGLQLCSDVITIKQAAVVNAGEATFFYVDCLAASDATFSWSIGSDSTPFGKGETVHFVFEEPGHYTVTVKVTDKDSTYTSSTSVSVNCPQSGIVVNGDHTTDSPIVFSLCESINGKIEWDFGDGTVQLEESSGDHPSKGAHIYTTPSVYVVKVFHVQDTPVLLHSLEISVKDGSKEDDNQPTTHVLPTSHEASTDATPEAPSAETHTTYTHTEVTSSADPEATPITTEMPEPSFPLESSPVESTTAEHTSDAEIPSETPTVSGPSSSVVSSSAVPVPATDSGNQSGGGTGWLVFGLLCLITSGAGFAGYAYKKYRQRREVQAHKDMFADNFDEAGYALMDGDELFANDPGNEPPAQSFLLEDIHVARR
eukprot:Colp12_sorted_trinity150504_noHs@27191